MIRLVTGLEMRKLDEETIVTRQIPASILMDHAGRSVAEAVRKHTPTPMRVCILCGKGNNGGDGWVAARWLKHWQVPQVIVVTLVHPATLQGDAKQAADMAIASGVAWQLLDSAENDSVRAELSPQATLQATLQVALPDADLYVDALLGTGVSRNLTGSLRTCVDLLNRLGRPVIAVDIPSGVDADSGAILGAAVNAVSTVALACEKLGTAVTPGALHAGRIEVADIGIHIGSSEPSQPPSAAYVTAEDIRGWLPDRKDNSHKGTYGKVAIGTGDMRGAALLAAMGAARVGAGLVRLGVSDVESWSHVAPPELVLRHRNPDDDQRSWQSDCEAIVIGPGLGHHSAALGWEIDVNLHPGSGVIDADALTFLVATGLPIPAHRYVLTPHPKECGVLLGCTTQEVQHNRIKAATEAARRYQSIVLLKGHRTIIATPTGNVRVIPTGNAALATAGTGDVLAGMIGGLLAQGLPPLEAACSGAYLHGRAGEMAGSKHGLASVMASDVVEFISRAIIEVSTFSHA